MQADIAEDQRPEHETNLVSQEAVRRRKDGSVSLLGSRCGDCSEIVIPPSAICPVCGSQDVSETEEDGEGRLYSYTVLHVGPQQWAKPATLGYVDLACGARVFAHLTGGQPEIGATVVAETALVGTDADGVGIEALAFRFGESNR